MLSGRKLCYICFLPCSFDVCMTQPSDENSFNRSETVGWRNMKNCLTFGPGAFLSFRRRYWEINSLLLSMKSRVYPVATCSVLGFCFLIPKDADTEFDLILFYIERMLQFDSLCAKCLSYATGCGYDWDVNAVTCSHLSLVSSSARCLISIFCLQKWRVSHRSF